MSRLAELFSRKHKNILSIYFTAGYPKLDDTLPILENLEHRGVDFVEIGMPFSDPVADGPVIQQSSLTALNNGMSIKVLFSQLKNIRQKVQMPLVLMGYFNPVLQFGIENFCKACKEVGIDGLIIPDLPLNEYEEHYKAIFEQYEIDNILLITPQTSDDRIQQIDEATSGFIYMVSNSSTTGTKQLNNNFNEGYFKRVQSLKLKNHRLIGFGISNKETFNNACQYANGAIIGSAFVKHLDKEGASLESIQAFVNQIRS